MPRRQLRLGLKPAGWRREERALRVSKDMPRTPQPSFRCALGLSAWSRQPHPLHAIRSLGRILQLGSRWCVRIVAVDYDTPGMSLKRVRYHP